MSTTNNVNTKISNSESTIRHMETKQNQTQIPIRSQQQTNPTSTLQPSDTYIPDYLSNLVPELNSYEDLIDIEKKLDTYLSRKQIDINQIVEQWNSSRNANGIFSQYNKDDIQYLRIFISNTAENQVWQLEQQQHTNEENNEISKQDVESITNGNSDPYWIMRIEGRLIDDLPADDPERSKFSSFIKDIAVDFKRLPKNQHNNNSATATTSTNNNETSNNQNPAVFNNHNNNNNNNNDNFESTNLNLTLPQNTAGSDNASTITVNNNLSNDTDNKIVDVVEWHADDENQVEFDGLDIKRYGSENLQCTVTIQPKGCTGNYLEYSPELSMIIGKSRGSIQEAVYSLYKYLLINNLLISSANLSKDNNMSKNRINHNSNSSYSNNKIPKDDGMGKTVDETTLVQIDKFLSVLLGDENKDNDGDINMDVDTDQSNNNDDNGLQENEIRRIMKLSEFLSLVNAHVQPFKPIVIDYTVRVDKASTYGELVFDIEVPKLSTLSDKNRIDEIGRDGLSLISELEKYTEENKDKLESHEREISLLKLQLNETAHKYQFFHKLGQDPVPALQDYIQSQANALKILSGDEGFNEDTVRRAQFYKDNEEMLFENIGVMLANGRI
ncbi:Rsc6p PWA37_004648 [Arxiozyma heterogenica]|uniref:Rsc6p n=1 Tax=Arxiozyma heterogenica TaxID=278026 RepID=UPI002F0A4F2A